MKRRAGVFAAILTATFMTDRAEAQSSWLRRYDGGVNADQFLDVAVASNGDVAVTGRSRGPGTEYDFITIRYDADGNELWSARYDNPRQSLTDEAHFVGVDDAGNTYVTGFSYGGDTHAGGTAFDYLTIKYGSDGELVWARRFNGPDDRTDLPEDMEVDVAGNVTVCGYSFYDGGFARMHVIRYGSDGSVRWQHAVPSARGLGSGCHALALGADGSVYAAGITVDQQDDILAVKFDPSGSIAYTGTYATAEDEEGFAIAVDQGGNAIVSGNGHVELDGYFSQHTVVVKFDPSGAVAWARYKAFRDDADDRSDAVAVDAAGNIYAVGFLGYWDGNDATIVSYGPAGSERWSRIYDEPQGFDDQQFLHVLVGSDGAIYVNALTEFAQPAVYDFTLMRFSAGGVLLSAEHHDTGSHTDVGNAFALDASNTPYFAGYIWNDETHAEAAVLKGLDPVDACPAAPGGLGAVESNRGVATLTWTGAAASFQIQRQVFAGGRWRYDALLEAAGTSYRDLPVEGGYRYRVRGEADGCAADWSAFKRVVPLGPGSLGAVVEGGAVTLNWGDRSDFETSFVVRRQRRVGGAWMDATTTATTAANQTTATDAPGEGEYRYRVASVNAGVRGGWTAWLRVTVR